MLWKAFFSKLYIIILFLRRTKGRTGTFPSLLLLSLTANSPPPPPFRFRPIYIPDSPSLERYPPPSFLSPLDKGSHAITENRTQEEEEEEEELPFLSHKTAAALQNIDLFLPPPFFRRIYPRIGGWLSQTGAAPHRPVQPPDRPVPQNKLGKKFFYIPTPCPHLGMDCYILAIPLYLCGRQRELVLSWHLTKSIVQYFSGKAAFIANTISNIPKQRNTFPENNGSYHHEKEELCVSGKNIHVPYCFIHKQYHSTASSLSSS